MQALHPPGGLHTHPAWVGSTDVSTGVALRQRVQQRLGLLEVGRVKPLGEPAIDGCEQAGGLGPLALVLLQASQAGGGAQLPGFGLLAVGHGEGLLEAGFGLRRVRDGLP